MRVCHGITAGAVLWLAVQLSLTAPPTQAACPNHATLKINGNVVIGSSFPLLGSPSGLAGQGPITIEVIPEEEGETFDELWVASEYECCITNSVNLIPSSTAGIILDCNDLPALAEAVYLEIGNGSVFLPKFGHSGGTLNLTMECESGSIPPLSGLVNFVARSTDIEGDADTDEADVDLLRAAIGTAQSEFDLDFDGGVGQSDLAIIVAEAKRHVVPAYAASSWANPEGQLCYGYYFPTPADIPTTGYQMIAPAAPVVSLTVLNATTTRLSWLAVADDPTGSGASLPASGYEVRRSSAPITNANWASANIVYLAGQADLGTTVLVNVSRPPNTSCSWYYAVKAKDDVDNLSVASNSPADQIDTTSPSAVTLIGLADLEAIKLTWTAPGDDGSVGQAVAYDLRYSTSVITAANFNSATPVSGTPNPSTAGTAECLVVSFLNSCTNYYFALKTTDDCGNMSVMSNSLLKKTRCGGTISVSCGGSKAIPDAEATSLQASGPAVVHAEMAEFRLAVPAQLDGASVRAVIYDVRGHVVRTLATGTAQAGESQLSWDLRNDHGLEAASGVYYLHARVGDQSVKRHIVVAR